MFIIYGHVHFGDRNGKGNEKERQGNEKERKGQDMFFFTSTFSARKRKEKVMRGRGKENNIVLVHEKVEAKKRECARK